MQLNPEIILTDFELATMNAIKNVFPRCLNKLCFFIYNIFNHTHTIKRHIQSAGLASRYNNDPIFAHNMRHISALAFLESTEISDAFNIIKTDIIPEEANKVIKWFDKYYVNGSTTITKTVSCKMTVKQRQPRFPRHMWSVNDSLVEHVPLTQNALESWHNRWNSLLRRRKWIIFLTINEFINEQHHTEGIIGNIKYSEPKLKRKCSETGYKERIERHLSDKNGMDMKTFLSGWAHICHLIK